MQKMNFKLTTNFFYVLAFFMFITACEKEKIPPKTPPNNPEQKAKVQFVLDNESVVEGSFQILYLNFDRKTTKKEKVVVNIVNSVNLEYGTHYTTVPAAEDGVITLDVDPDQENASIKLIPVDNNEKDLDRELQFSISTEGTTLKPHGKIVTKLTFLDNDIRSKLSFAAVAATIGENNGQGYEVVLNISPAASVAGHIDLVYLAASNYGQHFNTVPAVENGKIRVPVQAGAEKASFIIKPVDDQVVNLSRELVFRVSQISTGLEFPVNNEFSLTINNDDREAGQFSIANIRQSFIGQPMYFLFDTFINGTITSTNDNLDPKVIYLQDGTGGIALKLLEDYKPRVVGNKAIINIEGGILKEVNGNLEVHAVSNSNISPTGFDIVNVEELTLQQLYGKTNDMEGRIVKIKNVRFADANGINIMEGNRLAHDGTRTITVRTESFASFADKAIPAGIVSVTGILVEVNGQYIIIPQTENAVG